MTAVTTVPKKTPIQRITPGKTARPRQKSVIKDARSKGSKDHDCAADWPIQNFRVEEVLVLMAERSPTATYRHHRRRYRWFIIRSIFSHEAVASRP